MYREHPAAQRQQNQGGYTPLSTSLELRWSSPKNTKTFSVPVCSPCCHLEKIQKYPLPYDQTTEQLHSPDCETPQFIINTTFYKIDGAQMTQITKNSSFLKHFQWKYINLYMLFSRTRLHTAHQQSDTCRVTKPSALLPIKQKLMVKHYFWPWIPSERDQHCNTDLQLWHQLSHT